MDTYGFITLGIGAIIWIASRKSNGWRTFGILLTGIGAGIVIGAVGAYAIVMKIMG